MCSWSQGQQERDEQNNLKILFLLIRINFFFLNLSFFLNLNNWFNFSDRGKQRMSGPAIGFLNQQITVSFYLYISYTWCSSVVPWHVPHWNLLGLWAWDAMLNVLKASGSYGVCFPATEKTERTHIFNMVKSLQTENHFIHKVMMLFFLKLFWQTLSQ